MQHILTAELLFLTFVKRTKNARLEILKMFKDFPFSVLIHLLFIVEKMDYKSIFVESEFFNILNI